MSRYIYEVSLTPDVDGGYIVTVPDLPGCITEGDTIRESVDMAADALMTYIASYIQDGKEIPTPKFNHKAPKGGRVIAVSFETDANYIMDAVSPTEAAELLGVSRGRVSQMIKAGQLNANRVGTVTLVDASSVRERLNASPKSGRPRLETMIA
jgi:excisionase family DNA binding protein